MEDIVKEIEKNYNIENIKVNNFHVWQILRTYIISEYLYEVLKIGKSKPFCIDNKWKLTFYNVNKLLKKYNTWLLTSVGDERFDLKERLYFSNCGYGLENYYKNKILILQDINIPNYKLKKSSQYISQNRINFLLIINYITRFIKPRNFKLNGVSIIREILKKYNLHLDYNMIIKQFYIYVDCFNLIFSINKPKILFIEGYYGIVQQALIYSAKLHNIITIEIQHGLICSTHYNYIMNKNIGKESFPDYIFTYGTYYSRFLEHNFVNKGNIYVVGNCYLEYNLTNRYQECNLIKRFNDFRKTYRFIVLVTGSGGSNNEKSLIKFINETALKDNNILYIYIMKRYNCSFKKYIATNNLILYRDSDFYQCISFCDYHVSTFSTCFLEALKFGKPSILIDTIGKTGERSIEFFQDRIIKHVNTPYELYNTIVKNEFEDCISIKNYAKRFYEDNSFRNLRKAINSISL